MAVSTTKVEPGPNATVFMRSTTSAPLAPGWSSRWPLRP